MFWLIFIANWVTSFVFTFGILFSAAMLTLLGLNMPRWGDTVWNTALFYTLSSVLWLPILMFVLRRKPRREIRWAFWIAWLAPVLVGVITVCWAIESNIFVLVLLLGIVLVALFGGYLISGLFTSLALGSAHSDLTANE
jgi:hypothetical protein